MSEEKTIYIRCTKETSDLLDAIRKRKLPNLSSNAQVITLIHGEAERLNVSLDDAEEQETKEAIELSKQFEESMHEPEIKVGLSKLAETKSQVFEDR